MPLLATIEIMTTENIKIGNVGSANQFILLKIVHLLVVRYKLFWVLSPIYQLQILLCQVVILKQQMVHSLVYMVQQLLMVYTINGGNLSGVGTIGSGAITSTGAVKVHQ